MTKIARYATPWFRCGNSKPLRSINSRQTLCSAPSDNLKSKSGPADQNLKWFVIVSITLAFALYEAIAEAQQGRIPTLGWLAVRPRSSGSSFGLLDRELRALGYVEGKNIIIKYQSADLKIERLPALAEELVRLKVDVIVAPSTDETLAAKNATKTIPIVFLGVGDPIGLGLVDSLARPGRNITGISSFLSLSGKRLEILKETVPKLARVAVLWDPLDPDAADQWKESQLLAKELKLQLYSMEVSSADQYESAFNRANKARSAALLAGGGVLANSNQKLIADLAAKHRLPAIYSREDWPANGGLMSYGADRAERFKRVAVFIDKILKGTKPADIPVEQPTKFEFVINLKAAKQIGLTIPPDVLARANRIIR